MAGITLTTIKAVEENMVDKKKTNNHGVKTYIKGLGFCSFGIGSNVAEVDVKDGKVLRIRPLHFNKEYDPKDWNPWEIQARDKVFKPSLKSLLPPLSLAYKKRIYSPNRIKYPLKRVDWDPDGERNPQNRGTSKYVRISWDEATDIIAKEIRRVHAKYGPYAILAQADGHGETKVVHGPHGCQTNLLQTNGRLHSAGSTTRQLGRLVLGRKACLGYGPSRQDGTTE